MAMEIRDGELVAGGLPDPLLLMLLTVPLPQPTINIEASTHKAVRKRIYGHSKNLVFGGKVLGEVRGRIK